MENTVSNNYERNSIPQNIRILLVPRYMSKEELANSQIVPNATVEAEYGEKVIKGKKDIIKLMK